MLLSGCPLKTFFDHIIWYMVERTSIFSHWNSSTWTSYAFVYSHILGRNVTLCEWTHRHPTINTFSFLSRGRRPEMHHAPPMATTTTIVHFWRPRVLSVQRWWCFQDHARWLMLVLYCMYIVVTCTAHIHTQWPHIFSAIMYNIPIIIYTAAHHVRFSISIIYTLLQTAVDSRKSVWLALLHPNRTYISYTVYKNVIAQNLAVDDSAETDFRYDRDK